MEENENKVTFESAFQKLEAIVNRMEKESLDLEEALKSFEEGKKTAEQCRKMLEEAELKLKNLQQTEQN